MSRKFALRCVALVLLLVIGLSSIALNAVTDPEQERLAFVKLYQKKFPNKPLEDYVYGALMLSEDAKQQYDSIMEWPPFSPTIEQGKAMWEKPFGNGKSYADCFPNAGKMIAGEYPKYDDKLSKVVTFEMAINQCRVANSETPLKISDMKTMGVLMSHARMLSDGMKMNIKVESPAALEKFEAGKRFFYTRRGQLNFACARATCKMRATHCVPNCFRRRSAKRPTGRCFAAEIISTLYRRATSDAWNRFGLFRWSKVERISTTWNIFIPT